MYVLADLLRAQDIARAYLAALQTNDEAALDDAAFNMPSAVATIFEEVGEELTGDGFGAPTEADICHAITEPRAHIYAAPGKRVKLLITTGPAISDGVLHERICDTRAEAKHAATMLGARPHNYRG